MSLGAAGFACPNLECGKQIQPPIETLFAMQPIFCPHCGLKLTLNSEDVEDTLNLAKELMDKVQKSE